MKSKKRISSFSPHEVRRFILPVTVGSICIVAGVIAENILINPAADFPLIVYAIIVIIFTLASHVLITRTMDFRETYGLLSSILTGIGLGLLAYLLPDHLLEVSHLLIIFGIVAVATISGRLYAYITLCLTLAVSLPLGRPNLARVMGILEYATPFFISIIVVEVILQIMAATQEHIHRLETINRISRQIMLSLDTEQTLSLINATIQDALEADTYFLGIAKGDHIHLDLFYDDGEYFNGTRVPIAGTLSGWVIRNQRQLFLPDLRKEVRLEGVRDFVIGREKTSLSWMGVPLKAENVTGIMALGAYTPNAFDQADMELLSNLAQHVSLALDNTIRHAQVEEQTRLDSLTGVYNHGYFLKRLEEQAEASFIKQTSLSLIMLDIDYFKQYNDTFGHLVGDRILTALCTVIKQHVKQQDSVGRWGGEEFIISLPGATGPQAMQVAQRIGETMQLLQVEDREKRMVPIPTVSQGVAVFPDEADEIFRLIDLADRRLYVAKERGRNQIEPAETHWKQIQSE
ncbi:MAG TPA: sensor domain-containing diguanylate cyclase [Anaerolineales bacterium]